MIIASILKINSGADPENLDPTIKAEFEKRMNEKYAENCEIIHSDHGVIKVSASADGKQIIASSFSLNTALDDILQINSKSQGKKKGERYTNLHLSPYGSPDENRTHI